MLQALPLEVLSHITDYLSPRSQYQLACTCRALRALLQPTASLRYQHSDLYIDGEWFVDSDTATTIRYVENVTVENSKDDRLRSDSLPSRKERRKLIEAIRKQSIDDALEALDDEVALRYALAFLPRLRFLKYICRPNALIWREKEIWEASLKAGAFRQLTYLEFHRGCSWDVFAELLRLPSLYSLYCKYTTFYASEASNIKPMAKISNLKVLQFTYSIISRSYWQPILGSIRSLEILAFDHTDMGGEPFDYDPRAVVEALITHHSDSLIALRLHSPEYLTDDERAPWKSLSMLPKLARLACRWWEILPDPYQELPPEYRSVSTMSSLLPSSLRELYISNTDPNFCSDRDLLEKDTNELLQLFKSSDVHLATLRLRFPDDAVAAACKVSGIDYQCHLLWRCKPFLIQDEDGDWNTEFNTFELISQLTQSNLLSDTE